MGPRWSPRFPWASSYGNPSALLCAVERMNAPSYPAHGKKRLTAPSLMRVVDGVIAIIIGHMQRRVMGMVGEENIVVFLMQVLMHYLVVIMYLVVLLEIMHIESEVNRIQCC